MASPEPDEVTVLDETPYSKAMLEAEEIARQYILLNEGSYDG